MKIGISTPFRSKPFFKFFSFFISLLFSHALYSQVVIIPLANTNDTSNRKPYGCFYGFERTHALYTSQDVGTTGNITKVGFWLNAVSNPAANTPVVIKMKMTTSTTITASVYDDASASATTVFSGNITSGMLVPNSWVTVTLNTPFNYSGNSLEIFVETNYAEFGGENYNAKQFRQSSTLSPKCEFWEEDQNAPTDYGVTTNKRPNVQLTIEPNCSGTPNPGNTVSTSDSVCANQSFTLSLQNLSTTPGITYQWQHSPNGNTLWSDYVSGTSSTFTNSQINPTYYRCIVTCTFSGGSDTSNTLLVAMKPFYFCYCASYASDDGDTKIDSVVMGAIKSGSDPGTCETYTNYTSMSTTIDPGQPEMIHVVNGSCSGYSFGPFLGVYIDYNHNAVFDTSELVYSYGPVPYLNSIPDGTFFVSQTALSGITGMRVILKEADAFPGSCGEYTFGETEDYLVNITSTTGCSGIPAVGTTLSSKESVCPNEPFTLSLQNYPTNSGITYQWQKFVGAAWQNIGGGIISTYPTYTVSTQTVSTQYRVNVKCTVSGVVTSSTPVTVGMSPAYECYCASGAIQPQDTKIDSVILGTIVTGTPPDQCETYTDYTSLLTDLAVGSSATIKVINGSCTGEFDEAYLAVYIDYDQSHTYEAGELVAHWGPTTGINTIPPQNFIVSSSALFGLTGMRVILAEVDTIPGPCGTFDYGETEDYVVNIVNGSACTVPPDAGVATASLTAICTAQNIILELNGNSSGIGQTYQWQYSTDGINWLTLTGETSITAVVTVASTTYYRCAVTCSGNTAYSDSVEVIVVGIPQGDVATDPIVIPAVPYSVSGDNFQSNCWHSDYIGITPQASPDIFYIVSFDTTGLLNISTCDGSVLNTYLHLLDDTLGHIDSNDNNGDSCAGNFASIAYHVETQPSTFYIVVEGHNTDTGFYHLDVDFIPDTFTQVNAVHSVNPEISIYPNPASDHFNVSMNTGKGVNDIALIKLYNTISQVLEVKSFPIVNGRLSGNMEILSSMTDGIYLLEISYGMERWNERVVIQH